MSRSDTLPDATPGLEDVPDFDLAYAVDDEDDPTTVTVFPEDGTNPTTTWITMDVDHAESIDEVV